MGPSVNGQPCHLPLPRQVSIRMTFPACRLRTGEQASTESERHQERLSIVVGLFTTTYSASPILERKLNDTAF